MAKVGKDPSTDELPLLLDPCLAPGEQIHKIELNVLHMMCPFLCNESHNTSTIQ